ncbi:DUF2200 domain-containing protein [Peptoniphilus sp. KCTC 25270]|uniref:DUF2200 family protein n=1 Tax=Peptoniphilus sp. KCTC 25270 TaxID=2897414 RepID=UPI001E46031A|nr:DUF2200 family protein [Peptoniphilus sp. KCTC 25270]MCD1147511.1 DUF2200 domain-containing protein [Peptoniphilus sp. KCTC 25270]
MVRKKVEEMEFSQVYSALIQKAEKKGRTLEEVQELTTWLTGYNNIEINDALESEITYGEFFEKAPQMNPDKDKISGAICGVKIAEIQDPLRKSIRQLDKLIDELAKGKSIEKIIS